MLTSANPRMGYKYRTRRYFIFCYISISHEKERGERAGEKRFRNAEARVSGDEELGSDAIDGWIGGEEPRLLLASTTSRFRLFRQLLESQVYGRFGSIRRFRSDSFSNRVVFTIRDVSVSVFLQRNWWRSRHRWNPISNWRYFECYPVFFLRSASFTNFRVWSMWLRGMYGGAAIVRSFEPIWAGRRRSLLYARTSFDILIDSSYCYISPEMHLNGLI